MFILKGLKVLCFDTLLQVFILKVDSGIAGALAEFFALRILLEVIFPGNVGGKGVRWLAGYFMGYYTIWLAPVKKNFVPFWELQEWAEVRTVVTNCISARKTSGLSACPPSVPTSLRFALLSLHAMMASILR